MQVYELTEEKMIVFMDDAGFAKDSVLLIYLGLMIGGILLGVVL